MNALLWYWQVFRDWTEARPWRYRIACAVLIPTCIPLCVIVGLVLGVWAGIKNMVNGCRAFVAGEPI